MIIKTNSILKSTKSTIYQYLSTNIPNQEFVFLIFTVVARDQGIVASAETSTTNINLCCKSQLLIQTRKKRKKEKREKVTTLKLLVNFTKLKPSYKKLFGHFGSEWQCLNSYTYLCVFTVKPQELHGRLSLSFHSILLLMDRQMVIGLLL